MDVFTIGFTRSSAERFFGRLRTAGVKRLVDVRLKTTSQLAGFAKQQDLAFFLRELCGAEYVHEPRFAPDPDAFAAYKNDGAMAWADYEKHFLDALARRRVEDAIPKDTFAAPTALLCSEPTADRCHRRLVVEYLRDRWGDLGIRHL